MRNIVIVAVSVKHFATGIGVIVNEFISIILIRHYRIAIEIFNAVVVPDFEDAQANGGAEFVVFGKRPIELRQAHCNTEGKRQ